MPVTKILTAGIGEANLRDINVYRERGGYKQWERAVRELTPNDVFEACDKSGLRGRGGAGFPTGRKWSFLAQRRPTSLSGVQLRRGRARHVQRSHAARRDAALGPRGHSARRVRDRLPSRVHLYSRRVQARLRDLYAGARGSARRRPARQESFRQRLRSRSDRRIAAPARTFAARRRGCSTRSKANAASRASSRRSRRSPVCTARRPS